MRHPVQHQQDWRRVNTCSECQPFPALWQSQFPQKLQRVNMCSNVQNCPLEATFKIPSEIAARDHVLGMALFPNDARRSNATIFSTCQHVFERGHFPIEEDIFSLVGVVSVVCVDPSTIFLQTMLRFHEIRHTSIAHLPANGNLSSRM